MYTTLKIFTYQSGNICSGAKYAFLLPKSFGRIIEIFQFEICGRYLITQILKESFRTENEKIDKFLKLEPGFPVFRQAIPAIYWPALGWLEWHFAFLAAV
jgi:hypothetical protein